MTIGQGNQALRKGQLDQAQHFFLQAHQSNDLRATIGLAQTLLAKGQLDEAERLAREVKGKNGPAQHNLLHAQIMGERGQRDAAVRMLVNYIERDSELSPLAKAILAEQKIRQGFWNEGTELFIAALTEDHTTNAQDHFGKVMHDMLGAVSARRIRPVEALKFINKVDYSTPADSKSSKQRFATYRQFINSGRELTTPRPVAPMIPTSGAPTPPSTTPPGVVRQSQRALKPKAAKPTSIPANAPPIPAPKPMSWPAQQQLRRPARVEPEIDRLAESLNNTPRNSFTQSMREQRRLNEELQNTIGKLDRPSWPSNKTENIDNIDVILDTQLSISEMAAERYEKDDFRVTHGSIFSEIRLEQCLNQLLQAIPLELVGNVSFHPNAFTQLEINIFDGWLDTLAELPPDPLEPERQTDHKALGLGTFIGESLARTYTAVWEFEDDPTRSMLYLGKETLQPLQMAMRWLASDSKEDFSLKQLQFDAEAALPRSRFVTSRVDHIDSTVGLTGQALLTRVAELWSFYLFKLARVPYSEFVSEVQELWQNKDVVIFRLPAKWCPNLPPAMAARGKSKRDGYVIAYVRKTGEFLMLSSRAHLALLLPYIIEELDAENARLLMRILSEYHGPSNLYITSDEDAQRIAQRTNNARIFAPQLQTNQHGKQLLFWVVEQNTPKLYAIQHYAQNNTWRFVPAK